MHIKWDTQNHKSPPWQWKAFSEVIEHFKIPQISFITMFKVILLKTPNHSWLYFYFWFVFLIFENRAHLRFNSWERRKNIQKVKEFFALYSCPIYGVFFPPCTQSPAHTHKLKNPMDCQVQSEFLSN